MGWMVPPAFRNFTLLTRPPWAFSVKSTQLLALFPPESENRLSGLPEPPELMLRTEPPACPTKPDGLFHDPTE